MAKRNNKYKEQLSNFEARKKDHAKDAELHKQAYANLEADEAFKAARCKYCPKCNRVIEKMSGCNFMRCGQDADGGNFQKGCGASFRWTEAKAYIPDIGMRKDMEDFNAVPPTKQKLKKHTILEGIHKKESSSNNDHNQENNDEIDDLNTKPIENESGCFGGGSALLFMLPLFMIRRRRQ